jgi:hypothetical protein
MKYYIGKIEERNGEFEYTSDYLFTTDGDPNTYAETMAEEWRGSGNWDAEHEGYWCEHTLILNDGFREVSKEDFDVLCKYLIVL